MISVKDAADVLLVAVQMSLKEPAKRTSIRLFERTFQTVKAAYGESHIKTGLAAIYLAERYEQFREPTQSQLFYSMARSILAREAAAYIEQSN